MNHLREEKILAWHDRELGDEERREAAAHLQVCEDCRQLLKHWEQIHAGLQRKIQLEPSEIFVTGVMDRIAEFEQPEERSVRRPLFPKWFLPLLGYGFAFVLMFVVIAQREAPVNTINTEAVLLSDVPQASSWTFSGESAEINKLIGVSKEEI